MRNTPRPYETYEQWRQRLLDETARFIEWGLEHPELVERIPRHRVGEGEFSERVKAIFWGMVARDGRYPD